MSYTDTYPRPDFVRSRLNWKCLNDNGWSLIFDDEDIGLSQGWHLHGPPANVVVNAPPSDSEEAEDGHRLAAFPDLKAKGFGPAKAAGEIHNERKAIKLPFVFQTPASGWGDKDAHEVLWYDTTVAEPRQKADIDAGHRVLVRFGAVDYEATVWAAGSLVGSHRGGHVPFQVDITDALSQSDGAVPLVLRVRDSPRDLEQPRGKQYWAPTPESIFYTPTSGIWQSVWLEVVPVTRIGDSSAGTVLRSDDIETGILRAKVVLQGRKAGALYAVELEASIGRVTLAKTKQVVAKDKAYVNLEVGLKAPPDKLKEVPAEILESAPLDDYRCWRDGLALWSVDHPLLYQLVIRLYDSHGQVTDEVTTYTGMRSVDWRRGDGNFRLNDEPIFQVLCLDQGYWPETGQTPPSPESVKTDILLSKKMGFNGCRKHQKVEDPLFLYWADQLGYIVWGEMANAYDFSDAYIDRFNQEWTEAVRRDINHPSILVWTPVNESWAYPSLKDSIPQRTHIRALYHLTKSLDPTRPINDNCGWEHVLTDLSTFHAYDDAPALATSCGSTLDALLRHKFGDRDMFVQPIAGDSGCTHQHGAPVLCTEFGGVNIARATDALKGERDWGYTTASDPADLLKRIEALVLAVMKGGHIAGFVYTQLTDVEQEVNGLYAFDRSEKIDPAEVSKIFRRAQQTYRDRLAGGRA